MPLPSPPPSTPASPPETWPGWAQAWREESGSYQRDVDVVIILGDTGMVRRDDVGLFLSEWWGVTPKSGGINRALTRVRDAGLVEAIPSRREKSRYPKHLLRLTERGRDVYRLIRGRDAVPALTTELMRRHKSPEHAMLNLETAIALWKAGYAVEILPDAVDLDVGTYYPDLVTATSDGQRLYVECERDTRKNPQERSRKWELYYAASEGHFAIATPDKETVKTIREEVLAWAGERSLTLWMASVDDREDVAIEWIEQASKRG
jgi:DNA-binding PadR family transcriptional regulator